MITNQQELSFSKRHEKLFRFLRSYLLFIAIGCGAVIFCLFHFFESFSPLKPVAYYFSDHILPLLIFSMLYLSFCRVKLHDMRPRLWHVVLFSIMVISAGAFSLYIHYFPQSSHVVLIEGTIMCILMPPAAAAAVIGGRLGGNEASIITGVLIGNLCSAIFIPLFFPLFTSRLSGTFFDEFLLIAGKIFPIIVLPLILAFITKVFLKKLHHFIVTTLKNLGFYLWAICLCTVSSRTISCIANSPESALTLWSMAFIGFLTTALHFGIGKGFGNLHRQRISAGQAYGQRNGVFGLWVALSFLDPAAVIAPGCYILWQNCVNSWQLAHREKLLLKCQKQGTTPYQE